MGGSSPSTTSSIAGNASPAPSASSDTRNPRRLLASWVDELEPGRRRRRAKAGSFADEQKREAVIALASRKAPAQEVAGAVGVTRAVLYKWMTCVKISDTEAWGVSRRSSSRRP